MSGILERFYAALWGAAEGYRSIWYGAKGESPTKHKWFENNNQAINFINALNKDVFNVYHACSLFSKKRRLQQNFLKSKAIWLDLDLKHTTLASLKEVLVQLKLLKDTPFGANYWVIFTGHGFHVYWIFEEYLNPEEWIALTNYFHAVLVEKQIQFDSTRVRDSASILRVIGSKNIKEEPIDIKLLIEGSIIKDKISVPDQYKKPLPKAVKYSDDFSLNTTLAAIYQTKSDIRLVAEKCAAIRQFTETGYAGNEPAWYAALSVCRHCLDGINLSHEYSSKDPSYTEAQTNTKLAQLEEKYIGPALCEKFNAMGCCGECAYKEQIKSPIQLGVVVTPIENVAEELPTKKEIDRAKELIALAPKDGWLVGKEGVYRLIDDIPMLVTLSPFYIIDLICEDSADLTVVTAIIRFYLDGRPHHFKLPLKLLADDKKLLAEFTSRRLFPVNKKHLRDYIAAYALNLSHVKPQRAVTSLGWQPDESFVYTTSGDAWDKNGDPIVCVLDKKMSGYAAGFEQKGSIEAWQKAVSMLDADPVFNPHLFSLLCAVGAVLLPFTSAKGFLLSLQGCSGCGKTLAHKLALSVWGNPDNAGILGTYDTATARVGRMATVKNLPLRLDEITTMRAQQLTGLVFELVNGRGRGRATVDGTLSNTATDWQTVTFVTTNRPMMESDVSVISEAERCRILELFVDMPDNIMTIGQTVGKLIEENYGLLGKDFIQWVIQNKQVVISTIDRFQERFQQLVTDDKRFWVSCGAIAFTAATILKKLKLLDINFEKLLHYFENILKTQDTKNVQEIISARGFETYEEFAHAIYDYLSGSIAVLDKDMNIIKAPEKEIKARHCTNHLTDESILYIRLKPVKEFVNMYFTESYKSVLKRFNIEDDKTRRFKDTVMRCYEFKLANGKQT